MKAKACTRCRQWKVKCDAGENGHDQCSRCRNLGSPCVFDGKFKRIPRDKHLATLQEEVHHLRDLLAEKTKSKDSIRTKSDSTNHAGPKVTTSPLVFNVPIEAHSPLNEPCLADKVIGDIYRKHTLGA